MAHKAKIIGRNKAKIGMYVCWICLGICLYAPTPINSNLIGGIAFVTYEFLSQIKGSSYQSILFWINK